MIKLFKGSKDVILVPSAKIPNLTGQVKFDVKVHNEITIQSTPFDHVNQMRE